MSLLFLREYYSKSRLDKPETLEELQLPGLITTLVGT
jgi:hypothetical protein